MDENGHRLFKVLFFGLIAVGLLSCRLPVMLYAALVQEATATPTITQTGTTTNTSTVTVTLSPTMTQTQPPPPTLMAPSETPLPVATQPRQPTAIVYTSVPYGLNKPSLVRPNGSSEAMRPWYEWLPVSGAYTYMIWLWRLDKDGNKVEMLLNEQRQVGYVCTSTLCQLHPDVTLTINKSYVWQIQAYGEAGYSPLSDPMTFKAARITETPGATATVTRTQSPDPTVPSPTVDPSPFYATFKFKGDCKSSYGASKIRVDMVHNRAYLVSRNQISIFDLSSIGSAPTPTATPIISSLSLISDLDYSSNADEVYLASYGTGFIKVNNLSTSPTIITPTPAWAPATQGYGQSIALNNTLLLVGTTVGVRVYDPLTMTEFKAYTTIGSVTSMMVEKDGSGYVNISTEKNGVSIANCSGLACTFPSVILSGYGASGSFTQVSGGKKYLYVAAYIYGLRIYDITNPTSPVTLGSFICAGCIAKSVVVSGKYAYVAMGTEGLAVVDISDPLIPKPKYLNEDYNVVDLDINSTTDTVYLAVDAPSGSTNNCFMGFSLAP